MVNLFGLGTPKCPVCGMKLGQDVYEWEGKKFCSQECKRSYRVGNKGEKSCH
ncbi:MAG: hypothetical protein HYW22_03015 [Candidatus Aenigmarchaeota archaeon]|nr:hypothetical protein [Candidatus Aenigmarchaeota archaeon]